MTIQEVCQAIEAETHTRTWAEASPETRRDVIARCIEEFTGEPEEAAKKVIKRRPRKPKAAPLTQHATAGKEDE